MNLESLFQTTRLDVLEAMHYLGYKVNDKLMPAIKIVDTIELTPEGVVIKAAYNPELNEIHILKETLNDPEDLYCCMCHELTHSLQPDEVFIWQDRLPYWLRDYEKEAYITQTYMYGKLMSKGKINKLDHSTILQRLEKEWFKAQINGLSAG